jgi:hypothetical protein
MANGGKLEICRLYLDLAHECLDKVARAKQLEEAEQLTRMCRCFIAEAAKALTSVDALPSSDRPNAETRRDVRNCDAR